MQTKSISFKNYFSSSGCILLLNLVHLSVAVWPREFPRIGLNRWLELDQEDRTGGGRWRSDFENITAGYLSISDQAQTFVVSSQITGLAIDCNATYPIKWVANSQDDADYYSFFMRVRYIRESPDVFNPRSNSFTAQLDFYGDQSGITGNYSCVSAEYPHEVYKTIFIYWAGTNPSNLILGGKTVDAQSKDGHYLILPCRVSRPDVNVNLYREVNSDWILTKSPFIKFNPRVGFRVNLYQFNGAYTRFKCAISEDEDEELIINVKKGIKDEDFEFNNTMDGNATIYYNKSSHEIYCCSNSSKPPKLHTLFCVEQFSCEIRRNQLHQNVNNGKRSKNQSCTSERIYTKDSGLLRCFGDGIDVLRYFYTDIPTSRNGHSSDLYFSFDQIKPENMLEISATIKGTIYESQNVTFSCETGFNYFAEGMQWALRWRNNSLKFFNTKTPKLVPGALDVYEQNSASHQSIRLQVTRDMSEIICFAPVWNDTNWVNKSFPLAVHETKAPHFVNPETEVLQWALNSTEQSIACNVFGKPTPGIRWRKNNRTLLIQNNVSLKRRNGTSTIVVHRVSHDIQGEYTCIAANFGGTVEKKFQVMVIQESSSLGTVGLSLLIVMIIILLGGVGFLVWKMQLQKKVIDHLAGIVFRDVRDVNANGNGNAGNNNNRPGEESMRGNSDINPFPSIVT